VGNKNILTKRSPWELFFHRVRINELFFHHTKISQMLSPGEEKNPSFRIRYFFKVSTEFLYSENSPCGKNKAVNK